MKYPYKHPLPFPSDSKKENVSGPFFFDPEDIYYPFPLSAELFSETGWPKSMCLKAHECQIEETDFAAARACEYGQEWGCPLFIVHFSEFAKFGECENIQVFEIGQDESSDYCQADLEKIVDNFKELGKIHRIPIVVLGHDEDQSLLKKSGLPSAGWVKKLWTSGNKLFSSLADVPEKVVTLLQKKAYRFPSIEVYRNFSFGGIDYGPVLRRVALCGADIPRIKTLDDILARYEDGASCLPVSYSEDKGDETLWLGGETMKNLTVEIKSSTGKFEKGEKVTFKDSKITGTLTEATAEKLVIDVGDETKVPTPGEEIIGETSGAIAVSNKKEVPPAPPAPPAPPKDEFAEGIVAITDVSGEFKDGEAFTVVDSDVKGKIVKIADGKLTIMAIGTVKDGDKIVGTDSKATAVVGKKAAAPPAPPSPYPAPPAPEKSAEFAEIMARVTALETQLADKDTKIGHLERLSEHQQTQIAFARDDRVREKNSAHTKSVEKFMEDLKSEKPNGASWTPAFVDEILTPFALYLDWDKPIKFAEDQEEKSFWNKFSEIFEKATTMQKEGKLFVPTQILRKIEGTDEVILTKYDEDGNKLDLKVKAYMKEHQDASYTDAFKLVYEQEV